MSKPRIIASAVADQYSGPNERTIEFASDAGGGLINFRVGDDGRLLVSIYRCDLTVDLSIAASDGPARVYRGGVNVGATR